ALLADVEQVTDHHHRVLALLQRLAVEEGGEAGQRFGVVVDGGGDVLLRGGELVGDLLVGGGGEGLLGHRVWLLCVSLMCADEVGWLRRSATNVADGSTS